jgi:hypothetical protein
MVSEKREGGREGGRERENVTDYVERGYFHQRTDSSNK